MEVPWHDTWDGVMQGANFTSTNSAIATAGVAGAAPAAVYQTDTCGASQLAITSLIPNTQYHVSLHFAEWYFTAASKRKFHVNLNGTRVLTDFDIFAEAGANKPLVKTFDANSDASGSIEVALIKGSADEPTIMGVDVVAKPGTTSLVHSERTKNFPSAIHNNGNQFYFINGKKVNPFLLNQIHRLLL